MAFSAILKEQGDMGGNMKFRVYQLTDVQDDLTSILTVKGWREVIHAEANNETDTDERIFASITPATAGVAGNMVVFNCGTNDDNGYAFLIGR